MTKYEVFIYTLESIEREVSNENWKLHQHNCNAIITITISGRITLLLQYVESESENKGR